MGKWKIAQILFTYPSGAGEDIRMATQRKADSIYNLLKAGADFTKFAKQFSDDKLTYMAGGELPEFGTGKFDPAFEEKVLTLKSDGELAQPFSSDFGIHLIKRISFTETPAQKENASLQYELKQKILQDNRIQNAKDKFSKEIITLIGLKKNETVKEAELFKYADSIMKNPSVDNTKISPQQ